MKWLILLLSAACGFGQGAFSLSDPTVASWGGAPAAAGGGGTIVTNFNDLIVNDLGSSQSTANATSYTATLNQPTTNALVLAMVVNTKASAPDSPSLSGNNLTWVLMAQTNNTGTASNLVSVFRAMGQPTNGTLTASFGGTETGCIIHAFEVQGADTSSTNGAGAIVQIVATNGIAANPVFTYTASTGVATNLLVACMGDSVNSATGRTAPTNWVMLAQHNYGTPNCGAGLAFQATCLASNTALVTATARTWNGVLFEVKPDLEANPTTRPTFVQSFACYTAQQAGNNFTNWLPNAAMGGNFIAIHGVFSYDTADRNPTIVEDKGDNVTQALWVTNGSGPGVVIGDWYVTNVTAGSQKFTFTFPGSPSTDFHVCISEFSHVASYSPLDVAQTTTSTGPLVNPGIITTTNNGDLILYYADDVGVGTLIPSNPILQFMHGGGQWIATQGLLGCSAACAIQSTASTFSPMSAFVQASADSYQCSVLAFRRGSGGTNQPTNSIYIARIQETDLASTSTAIDFLPFTGNLGVSVCTYVKSTGNITAITNNTGDYWTKVSTTNTVDDPQMFYIISPLGRNNPPVKCTYSKVAQSQQVICYDIINANASPYDTQQEASGSASVNSQVTNASSITPTTSNGLLINVNAFDTGPPACSLNSAHIASSVCYVGSTDASHLNRGDMVQHYFNPDTTVVNFGQQLSNSCCTATATAWYSLAVSFKGK